MSNFATTKFDYPVSKSRPRKTVYTERFEIGGRKIRYEAAQPLKSQALNEGDEVMVAGVVQNGTFNALALKNFTTGVASHQSFFFMFLGGMLFSSAGIFVLIAYGSQFLGGGLLGLAVLAVFPGIFFLFSGGLLYFGYRTVRAVIAVRAGPVSRLHS
ncbi:MAG: hypothetical protein Q7J42_16425 [Sulfuritalea sp.]|nr:hypothetical protein [Sulfuritalea sp.]